MRGKVIEKRGNGGGVGVGEAGGCLLGTVIEWSLNQEGPLNDLTAEPR